MSHFALAIILFLCWIMYLIVISIELLKDWEKKTSGYKIFTVAILTMVWFMIGIGTLNIAYGYNKDRYKYTVTNGFKEYFTDDIILSGDAIIFTDSNEEEHKIQKDKKVNIITN